MSFLTSKTSSTMNIAPIGALPSDFERFWTPFPWILSHFVSQNPGKIWLSQKKILVRFWWYPSHPYQIFFWLVRFQGYPSPLSVWHNKWTAHNYTLIGTVHKVRHVTKQNQLTPPPLSFFSTIFFLSFLHTNHHPLSFSKKSKKMTNENYFFLCLIFGPKPTQNR